jgi:hypothetical protein
MPANNHYVITKNNMKNLTFFSKALILATGIYFLSAPATYGLEKSRVLNAETTYNQIGVQEATYYFTFKVPNVGKDTEKVIFTQSEGIETIAFDEKNSIAFAETDTGEKQPLGISVSRNESQKESLIVTFNQPVAPGTKITIALKPVINPSSEGIYLFQVKTLLSDQKTTLPIGTARLQFYDNLQVFDNTVR